MNTPRKSPPHRPSRPITAAIALGAGLVAVLVVGSCYAFNRVVLGEGLGLALPTLIVRIGSAALGTAAAALVVTLAFRLVDGPAPSGEEKVPLPSPAAKTVPRWDEPGKGGPNGHVAMSSRGKEESPWI